MKKIGLWGATAIGLGAIIGAGIFVLSGVTINLAGTGALIAFIITGIAAAIIALEMGELSSEMPHERGATYSFTYQAFGSELGFVCGILMYLAFTASAAAIAIGFGSYFASLLGISSSAYAQLFSILIIVILSILIAKGTGKAAETDILLVSFKVLALIVFILFAFYIGNWSGTRFTGFLSKGAGGIFSASVIAMFAYAGFQTISSITPDIEGGGRTAAKAIILSVVISGILYVLVTGSMISLANPLQYTGRADPLNFALTSSGAPYWLFILIGIAAVVATTSASLGMLLGGSMLVYQMSKDGLLPHFLKTHKGSKTPINSIIITAFFSMLFLGFNNIYIVAAISNFGLLLGYLLTGFAFIKLRMMRNNYHLVYIRKELKRMNVHVEDIFEAPLFPYLPIAGMLLLITFFFGFPEVALASGIVVVLLAILIYYTLREVEHKPAVKVRFFK